MSKDDKLAPREAPHELAMTNSDNSDSDDRHSDHDAQQGPRTRLTDTLGGGWLEAQLLLTTLATGVLDAVSFGEYAVFASNQTGNVILLPAHAIGLVGKYRPPALVTAPPLLSTGLSLVFFLLCAFISGQIGARVGHCRRGWFLTTGVIQAGLLLLVATLTVTGVLESRGQANAIPVSLLATVGGLQVSLARCSGIQEVPTAMLTGPMVDFLTLPTLFSLKAPHTRDLRALYLLLFVLGIVLGSLAHSFSGPAAAMYLGFGLRCIGIVVLWFQPAKKQATGSCA